LCRCRRNDAIRYTDCLDTTCNICGYERVAPGHYDPNPPTIVTVGTASVCQRIEGHCVNCGATYTISTTSHLYTNCADAYCNTCSYNRSTASGILYADGHVYTDCLDTVCNRSGCGHTRTAPGHSYTYGSWIVVATSSTCRRRLASCVNCSYSYYQYDYTHSYPSGATYYSSTQHYHTCGDCGYRKYEAHTYTSIGGGYLCTECGYFTYTP
jgi:hypothetical protein